MATILRDLQHSSSEPVARRDNDGSRGLWHQFGMSDIPAIHSAKEPHRAHFIREWMEHRGLKAADLARATGANPGTVSRWLQGQLPRPPHQQNLADAFQIDVADLWRHPDDDWMSRFLKGRSEEEKERIRATLEAAFPRKIA